MSRPASPTRIAAIAGTLAGLLAAGLGAYYLHLHQSGAPATPPTAGAPAPSAAATTAGAEGGPVMRSREQAMQALMALPELKAWSARIEQDSGGKRHGALIEYDPAPRRVNGKRYWQLSFAENSADAAERWESFLVSLSDEEILIEDPTSDELLSLERWRKEQHPMARGLGPN